MQACRKDTANTGVELKTLTGHQDQVISTVFNSNGSRIVSGSFHDGEIKLWDVETGAEVLMLAGHDRWLKSLAFSPDGSWFVSSGLNQPIKLWESTTPTEGYGPRRTGAAATTAVDKFYGEHHFYAKVIDQLANNKAIDESTRRLALQIANARLWQDTRKTE